MSFANGPPAPPPLRKSRWSWWKPVKGTAATDEYYYNRPSNSGSDSRASSRPSSRKARSSLSVLDDKRAELIRKDIIEHMAIVGDATNARASGATVIDTEMSQGPFSPSESKNNRKSTSRPPPAWYNRPYHQRYFSESASLQRPGSNHDDGVSLRYGSAGPIAPSLSMQTSMATGPQAGRRVSAGSTGTAKHSRPRSGFYPPAAQDFAIRIDVPVKDKSTKENPSKEQRKSRTFKALEAPAMDPMIAVEGLPGLGGRPSIEGGRSRRGSSSTTASFSTAFSSRDSFESRGRASSWGSQTSLESAVSSNQTTGSVGRRSYANYQLQLQQSQGNNAPWKQIQRPAPIKPVRKKAKPGVLFAALPGEVLELILHEVKKLHLQPGSTSCVTCWMRDCCSIALSARKWLKFARVALYEDIQLVGGEGLLLKKRYKINHCARMTLLRRTLRNTPHIAVIVRSIKVPSLLPPGMSLENYHDLVASVVMACPNLERLAGFALNYRHAFSRLLHALSTRRRLKDMNWVIEPSPYQRQHRIRPSMNSLAMAPGDLQPQQSQAFFDHHVNGSHMTSLMIHCRPGATLTPDFLLTDTLRCLPALQNLHLSHLPYTSFNDTNLLSLPPVKKLTLSHLPGVTTPGLSSFATSRTSTSINTLTLVDIHVDSLPALARIFSNLTSLTTFSMVQSYPPVMPTDEFIMLFPYLASSSLHKLHWDIPYLPTRASVADTILSRSISAGGFPALRVLRAPNDPEGVFQALCRPRDRVDCPADRYRYTTHTANRSSSAFSTYGPPAGHGRAGSRTSSFGAGSGQQKRTPPTSPGFAPPVDAGLFLPREHSDLHAARLAAQARLEAATRFPRYFVNVFDEEGTMVEKYGIGSFMGTVESKINYLLLPDAGATDEGGGLVGVKELLGDNGEEIGIIGAAEGGMAGAAGTSNNSGVLGKKERARERSRSRDRGGDTGMPAKVREGCTGRWNISEGAVVDKKDRERVSHAERGRWRSVTLS